MTYGKTAARQSKGISAEALFALVPLWLCAVMSFNVDGAIWAPLLTLSAIACAGLLLLKGRLTSIWNVLWAGLALAVAYLLSLLSNPTPQGAKNVVALLTALSFLAFFFRCGDIRRSSLFFSGAAAFCVVAMLPSILGVNQKNADGGLAFYAGALLAYLLLHRIRRGHTMMVLAFGSLASFYAVVINFRVMIIYGILTCCVYAFLRRTKPKRGLGTFLLLMVLAATAIAVVAYTYIEDSPYLAEINDFLVEKTGRTATSGRQLIWPYLVAAIVQNPLFGLGAGALPADLTDTTLSSHNYYLQVALQVGFIGLGLVMILLVVIWRRFCDLGWADEASTFGASIFMVFVLHNASEVIMFQNTLRVAVPAWALIGLALAPTLWRGAGKARGVSSRPRVPGQIATFASSAHPERWRR